MKIASSQIVKVKTTIRAQTRLIHLRGSCQLFKPLLGVELISKKNNWILLCCVSVVPVVSLATPLMSGWSEHGQPANVRPTAALAGSPRDVHEREQCGGRGQWHPVPRRRRRPLLIRWRQAGGGRRTNGSAASAAQHGAPGPDLTQGRTNWVWHLHLLKHIGLCYCIFKIAKMSLYVKKVF